MKLLVISHTPHYLRDGVIVGWGPTVVELDHLSTLFDELVHVSPLHDEVAPASALSYSSPRVRHVPLPFGGGDDLGGKLRHVRNLFIYGKVLSRELEKSDAVHVRAPAAISLLAILLLIFKRRPLVRWVKYAGNWGNYDNEPFSYRLQKWLLARGVAGVLVTINGRWPDMPSHIRPFFNPSMTLEEWERAANSAKTKQLSQQLKLVFVGALNPGKGVLCAIDTAILLQQRGFSVQLDVIGDGPEMAAALDRTQQAGMADRILLHGWQPRANISNYYANAHFILLPSRTEGWPKVLSEAMVYGVVPIASAVSSIPQYLRDAGAGTSVTSFEPSSYAATIAMYLDEGASRWTTESRNARGYARHFTFEHYLSDVQQLFAAAGALI